MKGLRYTVIKNAAANVMRGCAGAAVAVALPHFLVHALDPGRFSAWSLILQIAAYSNYLDFGLQTAVARFLAQAIELEQRERRDRLISTALLLLSCAGALAFLVIGFVVVMLPRFFHGVPGPIVHEVQVAAIILGASAALLLPSSVYTGVLVGLQRNEVPAMAMGGSRIIGAIAVIVASNYTHSLIVLAICLSIPNLFAGAIQWIAAERLLPGAVKLKSRPQRAMARELLGYCAGLMIFFFGAFLCSGLDTTIVGHFAFLQVGFYSIAASVIAFALGINSAVINALLSPVAALHARGDFDRVRSIVLTATRFTTAVNLLVTAGLCLYGPVLLRIWVGPVYARLAYPIVVILMFAQLVRQTPGPYCVMLVAAGKQLNAAENSLVEAFINVTVSWVAASYIGARGVAGGTLVGAICAVAWVMTRTLKKDCDVVVKSGDFLRTVLPPVMCSVPVFALWLVTQFNTGLSPVSKVSLNLAGFLATFALMIKYSGLIPPAILERVRMRFSPVREA
jgi:O-antigen/teichoic acid export membrane protein